MYAESPPSMALAVTPQLLSVAPSVSPASEGGTLTVRGHGFSTATPSDNWVLVGTQPCSVVGATVDTSYVHPSCPVASCTEELPLVEVTCTLPHNHAFGAHALCGGASTC